MSRRLTTMLSTLTAVAVLGMAAGPAGALAASPSGEGDMYQPWVPGEPEPKPKPKPSQEGPAADPGYTSSPATDTVVIVGALTPAASEPKAAGTVRDEAREVIAAMPASGPSLEGERSPPSGPSQAPAIAAMVVACLGCAWLLRPRRG